MDPLRRQGFLVVTLLGVRCIETCNVVVGAFHMPSTQCICDRGVATSRCTLYLPNRMAQAKLAQDVNRQPSQRARATLFVLAPMAVSPIGRCPQRHKELLVAKPCQASVSSIQPQSLVRQKALRFLQGLRGPPGGSGVAQQEGTPQAQAAEAAELGTSGPPGLSARDKGRRPGPSLRL